MKDFDFFKYLSKFLKILLLILSGYFILSFVIIAVIRMPYPFDIEWMEGGMVEHSWRLINELSIYTPPSLEFIPFIYTPIYFYLSAFLSEIFGIGFFPLRLLSFVSSLVILYFIYLIVKNQTGSKKIGIISSGFFAACYQLSGFWYDLARVDSLFLALFIVSFYFYLVDNKFSLVISGVFAALSFLTKQTALIFVVPLMIYSIYYFKWKSLYYILSFSLVSFLIVLYFNISTQGWFYHWLVEIPVGHQWLYRKFITFWIFDIFQPLFFAFAISVIYLLYKFKNREFSKFYLYLSVLSGLFLCSWLSRIHLGGYDNVLMPAFLGIALTFGLGMDEIFRRLSEVRDLASRHYQILFLAALSAQFFSLVYNPLPQLVFNKDYEYGYKLIRNLKNYDKVFIPDHPYISRYASKASYSHYYVLKDFFESNSDKNLELRKEYLSLLEQKYFDAIILDTREGYPEVRKYYKLSKSLFPSDNYFKCKTGGHLTRPEFIFIPK